MNKKIPVQLTANFKSDTMEVRKKYGDIAKCKKQDKTEHRKLSTKSLISMKTTF